MRAEPWVPRQALFDETLAQGVAAIVRDWALHWLGPDRRIDVRAREGAALPSAREAQSWKASGLVLSLDPRAPIGWWMLGLSPGAHKLKPADEGLMERLAETSARDLVERSAMGLLGVRASAEAASGHHHGRADIVWSISVGGSASIAHLIATPALGARARLRLLAPAPALPGPAPRATGIDRQLIEIGAMVGKARMALADMQTLALGDVVVLDRGPNEAAELAVNGRPARDTFCELRHDGGRLNLRLAQGDQQQGTST